MIVYKCKMCGGDLEFQKENKIAICLYCQAKQTVPLIDNEKKANMYNRANHFRQSGEFDRAMSIYEHILEDDSNDAEAYWSIVLCKYGIEYVDDPVSMVRKPTINRTQEKTILKDTDYLMALEYADSQQKELYQQEAIEIDKIQMTILQIAHNEKPYDIFISYKEKNSAAERTISSVLAQDIYDRLNKEGYRAFFSRVSLEDKVGQKYEPYIYSALNSAKVMLVVGTTKDEFIAPWVKNEWSRFLLMMREDSNKLLIPCFRDIDIDDLPNEFQILQSQDMSKIGFEQDLLRGISKVIDNTVVLAKQNSNDDALFIEHQATSLERLLQNSQTYLKLGNYEAAEEVYTTVTKEYPEDHRGWWGLIVCKTHNFTELMLDQQILNTWFEYVRLLSEPKDFDEIEKLYVNYARKTSVLDVERDIRFINEKISEYYKSIENIEEKIHNQNQTDNHLINKQKQIISESKGALICGIAGVGIGIILLGIGAWHIMIGGFFNILFGIIVGYIGLTLLIAGGIFCPASKYSIEKAQKQIRNIEDNTGSQVRQYMTSISDIRSRILACKEYIQLGEDSIASFWFAERCSKFGVQQPVEPKVLEYRKTILEIGDL